MDLKDPQIIGAKEQMILNYCPQCGVKNGNERFCYNCGRDNGMNLATQTTAVMTLPPPPAPIRPTGIAVMCVLWSLGGLYNLFTGLTGLGDALYLISMLSYLDLPFAVASWASWAIPLNAVLVVSTIALGLLQLAMVYGLWKGRRWSHGYSMGLPIAFMLTNWAEAYIELTAPSVLELQPNPITPIFITIFGFIYIAYLNSEHVREFLGAR